MSPLVNIALIPIKSGMRRIAQRRAAHFWILLLLFLLTAFPLLPQEASGAAGEPLSFVGMTLAALIERFGTPAAVFTARGNEPWQDDVVFRYIGGDFYIYMDRVWQVRLVSAFGVSNGNTKTAALTVLSGNAGLSGSSGLGNAQDRGDHALLPVTGAAWPLTLRINFSETGLVSAIYLYRPDF